MSTARLPYCDHYFTVGGNEFYIPMAQRSTSFVQIPADSAKPGIRCILIVNIEGNYRDTSISCFPELLHVYLTATVHINIIICTISC